jgi:transposase
LGRSRGGFGSKFHLITDGEGTPLAVEVTAGQVHESTQFESVVATFIASRKGRRRKKPRKVAADKGYSVPHVRDWLRAQGINPVIPHKKNEKARYDGRVKFDRQTYKRRAVIEQCVGWLKECRRIGTRFEKLAVNFHGMLQLAMIRRYLKLLF